MKQLLGIKFIATLLLITPEESKIQIIEKREKKFVTRKNKIQI